MNVAQKDNNTTVKDNRGQIIILKSQKLASAVYLVSKFMSDEDPLKWRLRDMSLKVSSVADPLDLSAALEPIRQMVSLIEIALHGQAVSHMNFTIIKQEYLSLRGLIVSEQTKFNPLSHLPSFSLPSPVSGHKTESYPSVKLGPIKSQPDFVGTTQGAPSPRKQLILNFIKAKGWSSIKDIAGAVPNFSHKTVQRELIELVRAGILKKEGERRWSRYQYN